MENQTETAAQNDLLLCLQADAPLQLPKIQWKFFF